MNAVRGAVRPGESEAWVAVCERRMPEECRTVIAWDSDTKMPCTAFFDDEEMCWYAQADGVAFAEGAITHWRHYVGPAGETSGDVS